MIVIVKQIGKSHVRHVPEQIIKDKSELKRYFTGLTNKFPPLDLLKVFIPNSKVSMVHNEKLHEIYVSFYKEKAGKTKNGSFYSFNHILKEWDLVGED